jgi:hypothetical protein
LCNKIGDAVNVLTRGVKLYINEFMPGQKRLDIPGVIHHVMARKKQDVDSKTT